MAQLIGIKERKEALSKINKYINCVASINQFLENFDVKTKEYEVSYVRPDIAKRIKAPFITDDGRGFEQFSYYSRNLYVKKIEDLCQQFEIELTEEELEIIYKDYGETQEKEEY